MELNYTIIELFEVDDSERQSTYIRCLIGEEFCKTFDAHCECPLFCCMTNW